MISTPEPLKNHHSAHTAKMVAQSQQNDLQVGPQGCPESVDPWSKCILDPSRGIGFTLSPLPPFPAGPLPSQMLENFVKCTDRKTYDFARVLEAASVPQASFGDFLTFFDWDSDPGQKHAQND